MANAESGNAWADDDRIALTDTVGAKGPAAVAPRVQGQRLESRRERARVLQMLLPQSA
jgi:hypothetical protein